MINFLRSFFNKITTILILVIFSPLIIIISILSIINQGFPILFIHKRLGKNAKEFDMIKFRTMLNGTSISAEDDSNRITKWGRFLRKSSLDELPALLNVLKGEMNLVGPRPLPTKYLNRFDKFQYRRMEVKPGVTGLAQIKGRNNISWEKKFEHDIKYIKKRSFLLDLKILLKTVKVVISRAGTQPNDSEIMPEFFGKNKSRS